MASSLAGCVTSGSTAVVITRCPPLKQYTAEQSVEIGKAREALRQRDPNNIMLKLSDDGFALRQQCRAIEGKL